MKWKGIVITTLNATLLIVAALITAGLTAITIEKLWEAGYTIHPFNFME